MSHSWLILAAPLVLAWAAQATQAPARFTTIGSFSNMRYTEEHQYGFEVELWRDGADLLGVFLQSEGLQGDTPIGLLEDVKHDPKTGAISFTARLTMGQHFCRVHHNVPSRELFRFQGTLTEASVSGVLKSTNGLHPELPPTEEKVVLKKTPDGAGQPFYKDRVEWEAAHQAILKARGPKW